MLGIRGLKVFIFPDVDPILSHWFIRRSTIKYDSSFVRVHKGFARFVKHLRRFGKHVQGFVSALSAGLKFLWFEIKGDPARNFSGNAGQLSRRKLQTSRRIESRVMKIDRTARDLR